MEKIGSGGLRRVVVTGMGIVSPLGTGLEENWSALTAGRSGIGAIASFDAEGFDTTIAGEVLDFDAASHVGKKDLRKTDRFIQFAVAASGMALEDCGIAMTDELAEDFGVSIGTGVGGIHTIEEFHSTLVNKGPRRVSPFFMPRLLVNMAAGYVSMRLGLKGPNECVVTACATGNHCMASAARMIRLGEATAMIAGGCEASISPMGISGFNALKALSTRNDEPQKASRPFDLERDGFVMGEGAGVVVLEDAGSAVRRGARIYAELTGYGATGDAHHITAPSPEGEGAARCMSRALQSAGIEPWQVDYINAHGTSTKYNDLTETQAIKSIFGEEAYRTPVSSTKSMTGHLLGAASGIEAIYSILALDRGVLPPTINLENPDPECDLDYVPNTAREAEVATVLTNSLGFGGVNASLVFSRFKP